MLCCKWVVEECHYWTIWQLSLDLFHIDLIPPSLGQGRQVVQRQYLHHLVGWPMTLSKKDKSAHGRLVVEVGRTLVTLTKK